MAKKLGLVFEKCEENCVTALKSNHIFLTQDKSRSFTNDSSKVNHVLIEGENYHALKVLEYTHTGRVDFIYIDPPYNTGNEDFVYNDKFVDKDSEFRHSKWLSMMKPRLEIAKKLLTERGVIAISIDDNEMFYLKLLCDEVFGEENFLANLIWKKKATNGGISNGKFNFNIQHEYVLVYANDKSNISINGIPGSEELEKKYKLKDDKDYYRLVDLAGYGLEYQASLDYEIESPEGKMVRANDVMGVSYKARWRWSQTTYFENKNDVVWVKGKPKTKTYKGGAKRLIHPSSLLDDTKFLSNTDSSLEDELGEKSFNNPKNPNLMKHLISVCSKSDSIILDFFAGSGTTGKAVSELNKEDGGTRQFILVTNNATSDKLPMGICHSVTYPRLQKTVSENLKYFKTEMLPLSVGTDKDKVEQLEDRLYGNIAFAYNTFDKVDGNNKYFILTNPKTKFKVAVWHNSSSSDAISLIEDKKKQSALKEDCDVLLINRPHIGGGRNGYLTDYCKFMKVI